MESFVSNQTGRTFVVKLVQGEDLLGSIEALIAEQKIKNAVIVSGIATFDRSCLHMISATDYPIQVYVDKKTDVPLEVVSVDGFICDGEPHIHCTISDRNQAYAGHLLHGCRILYLGELVIQELLGLNITRHPNELGANHIYAK
ncbi:MAG: DNA-binding protein [Lachnospiraceae bacterium]|nr:DNA-binding protein [Lachnospiraceae bacterium]